MISVVALFTLFLLSTSEGRLESGRRLKKGGLAKKGKKGYMGTKRSNYPVSLGARNAYLIDSMDDSDLKDQLMKCHEDGANLAQKSDWSIGHRGACLQYPEHTLISYEAALIQGAGIVECDVTFTKDKELICRHAQCDLHTTTDVVARPEMNAKCTVPWSPGVSPRCCATDFTLEEIKTLCAKMDSRDSSADTAEGYLGGVASWRTTLYSYECPEVPTHMESIELIKKYGAKFTPELKSPQVDMPYEGDYTQEDYAQQLIDEYIEAGVDPSAVWPQSFKWSDAIYWVENTDFYQAVALEGTYGNYGLNETEFASFVSDIKDAGVKIIAPPMWMLLDTEDDKMIESNYSRFSKDNGFDIITWTLERSGPLVSGGGWYYQSVTDVTDNDGVMFEALNALEKEVGIIGIFSDWPATTTFYANCMGL